MEDHQFVRLNDNDNEKPHAICIPCPAQGHINPMLNLAKLLHSKGFHITFVHTEFNHNRLIQSGGPNSLKGTPDFRFETISDGLPDSNSRGILDLPALCNSIKVHGKSSFRDLVLKLLLPPEDCYAPAVSCIVSDGVMGFTVDVAQEFGIPEVVLFTPSGCGVLGYLQYQELVNSGYFPLKDESYLSNGYLDTVLDWIPGMKGIRLRDLPTFLRTTNRDDTMFNYNLQMMKNAKRAKAVILNTFDELEQQVLCTIKTSHDFPSKLYTIGPLSLLLDQQVTKKNPSNNLLGSSESNLWREDMACLDWLDKKEPKSVLYVNFGSLVTMTSKQLSEFGYGLANSGFPFLWVIRANLADEEDENVSEDILEDIKGKGLILGWCPQEKVLGHPSIKGFLTHCGRNSTLESLSFGVPMICWPFFAEQQTNCFYCCGDWGVGLEIREDFERGKVEEAIKELMEGERGREMREKCEEWKRKAHVAVGLGGSSYGNFERLVEELKEESIMFRKLEGFRITS